MQLHCNLAPQKPWFFFFPNLFVFFWGAGSWPLRSGEAAEVILNWVRATLGWFWRCQHANDVEKKRWWFLRRVRTMPQSWKSWRSGVFWGDGFFIVEPPEGKPTRNFVLRSTWTQSWVMKFGNSWRRVMNPRVKANRESSEFIGQQWMFSRCMIFAWVARPLQWMLPSPMMSIH